MVRVSDLWPHLAQPLAHRRRTRAARALVVSHSPTSRDRGHAMETTTPSDDIHDNDLRGEHRYLDTISANPSKTRGSVGTRSRNVLSGEDPKARRPIGKRPHTQALVKGRRSTRMAWWKTTATMVGTGALTVVVYLPEILLLGWMINRESSRRGKDKGQSQQARRLDSRPFQSASMSAATEHPAVAPARRNHRLTSPRLHDPVHSCLPHPGPAHAGSAPRP
jgi:hypothetical protein